MPVDKKLLEILCCPATKIPVKVLPEAKLDALNLKISEGEVRQADGSQIETPLEEALITDTGSTIYRVESSIPVMLEDQGIPTAQLGDF